ncbi:MAG: DNA recombination protein RmuC [Candidatus Moranbacteria bacterium]|nr:DNA recombination protein RmuC [Candidatus Moranbacteria bacterium]
MEKIIIILIVFGFAVIIYLVNRKFEELKQEQDKKNQDKLIMPLLSDLRQEVHKFSGQSRNEIQNRLDRISDLLSKGIDNSTQTIEKQFKESRNLIDQTARKIERFEQTNKKIADFAGQMQSLENILRNPKQRGVLGEYYLESMLKNVFEPDRYKMQYRFKNGDIVDAAIFYKKKILPIDSKFTLRQYNEMVEEVDPQKKQRLQKEIYASIKKRIDETAKYIRPKESTFDFAFMFIPSEGLYHDLLNAKIGELKQTADDLIDYAYRRKVILVSPTSFYAYLQTVLHGLSLVKMKESIGDFKKNIEKLDRHLKNYQVYFQKVGVHLATTVGAYNNSAKEFAKIDKDVYRISQGKSGGKVDVRELEKPELED